MADFSPRINPFDLVKASDFTDEQIYKFWVDLSGEAKLFDLFQPTSVMPMMLLGGKGSGKTHLMRYYSSSVRKIGYGGDLATAINADQFLGIYVRADGLNVGRFSGKRQDADSWAAVFAYYFEIWLTVNLLRNVAECLGEDAGDTSAATAIASLFSSPMFSAATGVAELIDALSRERKRIDNIVSNVATGRTQLSDVDISFGPGELLFGTTDVVSTQLSLFDGVRLVFMIDEIENFASEQQQFLNSLIRYRRGQATFKVGSRLYGIRTRKTLGGSEEEIREGAEFDVVRLDEWSRANSAAYAEQAKGLVCRRLNESGFLANIENVSQFFEAPDPANLYQKESLRLMERYDKEQKERPHFVALRSVLGKAFSGHHSAVLDEVVDCLTVKEHPILEKVNIYLLCKEWRNYSDIVSAARSVGALCDSYLAGARPPAYVEPLDHFKSDFFAQLARESRERRVIYAGLDTLIHLSQGIPRNLLGLLKHIYRRSHFRGERPFEHGSKITIRAQGEGVGDAAAWFWEDAQPDQHGPEVRAAVQSVAELFRAVRFSIKPAECDLGTFTIKSGTGTPAAKRVLNNAENWSYLIKIQGGGVNRNDSASIDDKYQLSPMLAPRWGVSEHRRGSIQLSEDLFNSMFDVTFRSGCKALVAKRVANMEDPFSSPANGSDQGSLL